MAPTGRRRKDHLITPPTVEPLTGATERHIAARAYELFELRGCEHGHDVDDWLQAERELRATSRSTAA